MTGGADRGRALHRTYTVAVFIVLASLDNVAIGLVPPLATRIRTELGVAEWALGLAVGAGYLVSAVAAVAWAYLGDRTNRKPLLMIGTLIWAAGSAGTALTATFTGFVAAQLLAALGLGAVASVGFSVVSDLISPRRRGLVMSLWGLSQAIGMVAGTFLAGALGAVDWRRPFWVLTVLGLAATAAYVFTGEVRRGASEPALAAVFAEGREYEHRISRSDLPTILRRRTNRWLILQGLTAQLVWGSLVWLPRLFESRALEAGYTAATATRIGATFTTLFQVGGVLSVVGGLVGDRLQRRTPRGRALVAAVGILASVPFFMGLFFVPLRLDVAPDAGSVEILGAAFANLVSDPTMALTFVSALAALGLANANSPNWFALIADVNPPEHRGTVYSLGNLVNGVGRAGGSSLATATFGALERALPAPLNYATGLALFQLFFIPTGIMFWLAARSSPADIDAVNQTLRERAGVTGTADP